MLANPVHFLALGLGSGLSPAAPGTLGTALALLLLWLPGPLPLWADISLVVGAIILGGPICGYTSRALGGGDHGSIVWDEFAGVWLTLLWVPHDWRWWLAAFVVFRALDILKPWPIRWADRRIKGGMGIMLDDLIAGAMGAAVLYLLQYALF